MKHLFLGTNGCVFPIRLFVDHVYAARLWFFTTLALMVVVGVQPYFLIKAQQYDEKVIILDGSGTYSISPLLRFEEARELHENISLLATMSLLSQNPSGFDYPDMLERMFYKEARLKAKAYEEAIKSERETKNIFQKQQVSQIKILKTRNEVVMAQVKGELIRCGVFEDKNFVESIPFKLDLTLVRNPDMLTNKRYPLAVFDFQIEK